MKLVSLMPTNNQSVGNTPSVQPDSNQSQGSITPDELFSYFDRDGDGKINIKDYVAHIQYYINNPATLEPYANDLDGTEDCDCNGLMERLVNETTIIAKDDINATDKAKKALMNKDDVQLFDKTKSSAFKIQEAVSRNQRIAGIIK